MASAPSVAVKYQRRGRGSGSSGTNAGRHSRLQRGERTREQSPHPTNQKFPVRKTKAPPRLSEEITRGRKEGRIGEGAACGHARNG